MPAAAQSPGTRILVMPFDNPSREPRLHWIAEAASLLVADELNARGVAAIRRAERVNAFEELHLPANATLSRATVIKVGQLVGASEVIVGSVAARRRDAHPRGARRPHRRRQGPADGHRTRRARRRRAPVRAALGQARRRRAGARHPLGPPAARGVRVLRQGADGRERGEPRDVPRRGGGGAPGLRPRAPRALGRPSRPGGPRGGAGRRPRRPLRVAARPARRLFRRRVDARAEAVRRGVRRVRRVGRRRHCDLSRPPRSTTWAWCSCGARRRPRKACRPTS